MGSSQSTSYALDLADGPTLNDYELGVHIICVPKSCDGGLAGPAALSQVASCIGKPEPTDIVVYDGKPWHSAGLPGHKKEPREHPKVHDDFPETILKISIKDGQKAVWWSEEDFTITSIKPSKHTLRHPCYPEADGTELNPFDNPHLPETRPEYVNGRKLFVARSTVPVPTAAGHMFKIEFSMAGQSIDPDMYCAP